MSLAVGDKAPDFTLPTDGGGEVSLAAFKGKPVIVYFYPKDDTSGCTKQACSFRDLKPDFSGMDAAIIGISKDSAAAHDKFKAKYELNFILASDKDQDTAERYGVWAEKSMYGRKYMGMERTTFLIDGEGTIRAMWPKVKVPGHGEEVLKAVKAL